MAFDGLLPMLLRPVFGPPGAERDLALKQQYTAREQARTFPALEKARKLAADNPTANQSQLIQMLFAEPEFEDAIVNGGAEAQKPQYWQEIIKALRPMSQPFQMDGTAYGPAV
jgi:hypothetical protein